MNRDEKISPSDIRDFIRVWQAADLPGIEPLTAAMQRYATIDKEFADIRDRGMDLVDIATKVADGLSLREALDEWAGIAGAFTDIRTGTHISRIDVLRDKARYLCLERARTWLAENAVALAGMVEDTGAEVVAAIEKLRPRLDGIGSAEDAARAGGIAAKAWIERVDLGERRTRLGEVRPTMQRLGLEQEALAG